MREDLWSQRAAVLAPYSGKGMTKVEVAREVGWTVPTVARYAAEFGFDFGGVWRRTPPKKSSDKTQKKVEILKRCAAEGKTRAEAAAEAKCSLPLVCRYSRDYGLVFFRRKAANAGSPERAEAMAAMYRGGKTLEEIGTLYGLTRERVRQIINVSFGMNGQSGGQSAVAAMKKNSRYTEKNRKCLEKYGCSYEQYREIVALGKKMHTDGASKYQTPTGAWHNQRCNARQRGIEWKLSLWEWWQIWSESGKWGTRGRNKGDYVMCRFGDTGAYEVGNVYIATCSHNCSVRFKDKRRSTQNFPDHASVLGGPQHDPDQPPSRRPLGRHEEAEVGQDELAGSIHVVHDRHGFQHQP